MNMSLLKEIMKRTYLRNKFFKDPNKKTKEGIQNKENTLHLLGKMKKDYHSNLDTKN